MFSFKAAAIFECPQQSAYGTLRLEPMSTCIEWFDKYIAELREVLPGAAGRPSPALAHQLKKTAEKAAKEEEDEACAYDPVVILRSARLDDFSH
jgi:hypothetical protein